MFVTVTTNVVPAISYSLFNNTELTPLHSMPAKCAAESLLSIQRSKDCFFWVSSSLRALLGMLPESLAVEPVDPIQVPT